MAELCPNFLQDPTEYASAEAYWRRLWDGLVRLTGQWGEWEAPWLRTTFANGTPFRDGDPIFSAISAARGLGVRIVQHEQGDGGLQPKLWIDRFGDEEDGVVRVLVISCALSEYSANCARDLILSWMVAGKVQLCREGEGPAKVLLPKPQPSRVPVPVPA